MRSRSTFSEEMGNIGPIPGVLSTTEETGGLPSPRSGLDELIRAWDGSEQTARPDNVRSQNPIQNDDWFEVPGVDGAVLETPLDWVEKSRAQTPSDYITEELGIDFDASDSAFGADAIRTRQRVAAATARLGTDAFATYLPWHKYAQSKRTPWGMWFFLEPLIYWAADLKSEGAKRGLVMSNAVAFDLAFLISYRHELFHYHVERFAIRLEILARKPVYLPYEQQVFSAPTICGTEHWLEEALAQAAVLESSLLWRRTKLPKQPLRLLLEHVFSSFGPGYRDFLCPNYGGPKKAHKVLGAQIATATTNPIFTVTEFTTPKREYHVSAEVVPGFLCFKPSFISRFQLAMPPARNWERFAKKRGLVFDGPGPGDHEVWRLGPHRVHINRIGKELDRNSIKAVAKILKLPLRAVVEEIRAA